MRLDHGRLAYEGVSLQFGSGTPYHLTAFKRGVAERQATASLRPRADGQILGRAFKGGARHELTLVADAGAGGEAEASELLRTLETVWDAAAHRVKPGFHAELWMGDRYSIGQPAELDPDDTGLWDGTAVAGLAFEAESDRWYGPDSTVTIGLVPSVRGGLLLPAVAPFVFDAGPTEGYALLAVNGSLNSWPVFEIRQQIASPVVWVGSRRLIINYDVRYDDVLVIDTRPWRRGVYLNGVATPGLISAAGNRLSEMSLAPGAHSVVLRGHSAGAATLQATVAATYPNL